MDIEKIKKQFVPMSETMLYTLMSLTSQMHGYGIMQNVEHLTNGRIIMGAGTVYQSLAKLEKGGLINCIKEDNRRKIYLITDLGQSILDYEKARITEIYNNLEVLL